MLGVIYTLRKTKEGYEGPINKQVIGTFESHRTLMRWLRRQADKRGYGRKKTLFLADGSEHIWRTKAEFFPKAQDCLDWFHVVEKLWEAGRFFHSEGSAELTRWVETRKQMLRGGKVWDLVDDLVEHSKKIPKTGPGTKVKRKRLSDIITHYGWGTDVHHPKGIFSGEEGPFDCNYHVRMGGGVPYRCIYSRNISNLLMAGRNISVSHYALGTTRIMMTCATLGQAAGTAAAMCAEYDLTPRAVGQQRIDELQQRMLREDQYIPRIKNEDPADLALKATVTASSEMDPVNYAREYALKQDGKSVRLNSRTIQCANGRLQALGTLHFQVDNQQGRDVDGRSDDAGRQR